MSGKHSSLPEESLTKDQVNARSIQTPLLLLKEEITEADLPAPSEEGQHPLLRQDRDRGRVQNRNPSVLPAADITSGSIEYWWVVAFIVEIRGIESVIV